MNALFPELPITSHAGEGRLSTASPSSPEAADSAAAPGWREVLNIRVDGDPKAQPRPRAFARKLGDKFSARVYDAGTAEGWKSCIAEAVRGRVPTEPLTGAVCIVCRFFLERPKGHFGSGKNANKLKASAPGRHLFKPDPDNLAKAVLDCLTRLRLYADDGQVVNLIASKDWCDGLRPGMRLIVSAEVAP